MHFLSAAEQAMEDANHAMLMSSPMPEPVLRKWNRQGDDLLQDGVDIEPDEDPSLPTQPQPLSPSIKNVTAAALRYSVKKKLRPEQRDEVDAFLLVSDRLHWHILCLIIGQDTALGRQAKLFACVLSLENKVDAFRSAAPPYQLSDELKVSIITISSPMPSPLNAIISTNINNYGIAVMLSLNISAYKGNILRNHVLVHISLIM